MLRLLLARAAPGRYVVGLPPSSGAALPAAASGALRAREPAQRRHMGILDRLRGVVENSKKDTMAKKKAEVFQWQLDSLASVDRYTMADYKAMLETSAEKLGLNDWRSMLRTKAQQQEVEDAWVDLRIANLMTPEEVADPSLLHRREKLRIATALGVEVPKVNAFLLNYEQTRTMHKWIMMRKKTGDPIPTSLEEYQSAMAADKRGIDRDFQKIQAPRQRSTRSALKAAFKGSF